MTDINITEPTASVEGILNPAAPGPPTLTSRLEQLRQRHERDAQDLVLHLPIAGWRGDLVAGYRILGDSEWAAVVKRGEARHGSEVKRNVLGAADILATACIKVMMRMEDGTFEEISPGFDSTLTELLQLPAGSQADLVLELFGHNGQAVGTQAHQLAEWCADPAPTSPDALEVGE